MARPSTWDSCQAPHFRSLQKWEGLCYLICGTALEGLGAPSLRFPGLAWACHVLMTQVYAWFPTSGFILT